MTTRTASALLSPLDVEIASERDGKSYELVRGELRERRVGCLSRFVATRICGRLNAVLYPRSGVAVVGAMTYCFARPDHGRKPDVIYVRMDRLPGKRIPRGDLYVVPELATEVLSPEGSAFESQGRLDEYLEAGVATVWIVNPEGRTIRIYRNDGTSRLFRAGDVIEHEPLLPGFRMVVGDAFPEPLKGNFPNAPPIG